MKIDKKLNLVIPVESENGSIFVHATPISRDVFEKYFLVISQTFAAIYSEGLGQVAGPRVAALMLKKIAVDSGSWDGSDGVDNGLMNEIRRLTNVVMPGNNGWVTMQYQDAIECKLISQDDIDEIEGNIIFFICVSAVHKKNLIQGMLAMMSNLWATQISSLNSTEFARSLPISTETVSSGGIVTASSVPS